ncbi:MAG: tRNA (N6-isopentenyl adenosine(37)-C2)-methylthiotransferase MiaB [Desulfovibrionaceae bacterium]|nr:tRNA (N6-isopentenyl adenosine(37)-C2)-methylthiotransferase MiaB [Desulfovibrionaceae bacterium]
MGKRFHILTFGCQMNANDSAWLARALAAGGHIPAPREEADLHILNTCSVRAKPENKVYTELGRIRLLAREHPEREILACVGGCVAQQLGEKLFTRSRKLRLLFGTDGLTAVPETIEHLLRHPDQRLTLLDFSHEYPERREFPGREDPVALVNIMQGCDNFCAYCIVPLTRGRQKSRQSAPILEECRARIAGGAREITLLGQNVNSFGQDSQGDGTSFTNLLEQVAAIPGLARLSFMTSHPKDMPPELIQAFGRLPALAPRLHLPLQSGSDRILRAMGRGYTRAAYMKILRSLRRACPDIHISTDIITGFPGESENNFRETLETAQEANFCASFSFAYSDRPGTKAASMPDKVPAPLALERLARLQDWQNQNSRRIFAARHGQKAWVLLEGPSLKEPFPENNHTKATDPVQGKRRSWHGREEHGFSVNLLIPDSLRPAPGDLLEAVITGHGRHTLKAALPKTC